MPIHLGNWQLDTVSGGTFRLDGGAMFGVVPKPLWERAAPADERNRIALDTNCVLARDGSQTALIDTGYGGKLDERTREIHACQPGEPLVENLAALGVSPEDVTAVVLSHLHFDHAGGGTTRDAAGQLRPTFPRATYYVHHVEWADATSNAPELRGTYPSENFLPLAEAGALQLSDAGTELLPGLRTQATGGHTRGHWAVILESSGQTAVYLGDLCPTSHHLKTAWCMGYDLFQWETRREKPRLLAQAALHGWWLLFDHDPNLAAGRIVSDPKREFVVTEGRSK